MSKTCNVRADLNPMEQAHGFERLSKEFNMTHEQISVRTGKDRASISNYLRLIKLPPAIQYMVVEGGILSFGHARALLGLLGTGQIEQAAQRAMGLSLSVRQTESMVAEILNPEKAAQKKEAKPALPVDPNVREVQEELQRALGLKGNNRRQKGARPRDYRVREARRFRRSAGAAGRKVTTGKKAQERMLAFVHSLLPAARVR